MPIEIPIWLTESDIAALEKQHGIELVPQVGAAERTITGHIDFLQVRNGAVHILDYKPDARTNKPIAQLAIYALALTRLVPGLKLFDIKCAWFNEDEYCEFFPRTLFAHKKRVTHVRHPQVSVLSFARRQARNVRVHEPDAVVAVAEFSDLAGELGHFSHAIELAGESIACAVRAVPCRGTTPRSRRAARRW